MADADKVIVSCALTGAVTSKKHCPAIPYTPVEIAEEARRAYEAGAAIVHIHARNDDGSPTWSKDTFARIMAETKARCPILINWSTGGAGPMTERVSHLALRPHVAALNMGSMNYAKWSETKKQFAFNFVFANSFDDILAFARAMKEHGAKPEMECFDVGHTNSHRVLADLGLIEAPFHFSFIMGVLGGIPATARHLAFQAEQVPAGSRWKVIGISREQWPLAMAALSLGGDLRVGLEDNFYLPNGEMAKSNGELVAAAAELVKLSGRSVATVDEVKHLLWPRGGSNSASRPSLERELARAIELARTAGSLVMRMQRGELAVEMKPGDEPVTVADQRASELIVAGLAASFRDDPIISEELTPAPGALGSPRFWLVDPIDGTKDFIRGEDGYSVMIGLVCDGVPTLGVVYQPAIDRLYHGTPAGAYVTAQGETRPLTVSSVATAGEARLVASKSHRSADLDRVKQELGIADELNIGSVGLKLCVIAEAVRDLYVNPAAKTKAWDTCAPEAILGPAGGRLSDLFGNPINYTHELAHRRGLVASNARIHDEVVGKLSTLFAHLA